MSIMADTGIPKDKTEFRYFILEVIGTLVAMIEEKDPFFKHHSERVANNSANFCEEFNIFDDEGCEAIYYAGMLHDIGVIGIPSEILHKIDQLTDEEMIWIRKHPVRGEKILSNLNYLTNILPMVRHHHEAIDGSGYPDGLKSNEIPLGGRILNLFNYFDNLAFPRSSKQAMNTKDALESITSKTGTLFDEKLIPDFIKFIGLNSGKSSNFMLKKETTSMKQIFTTIFKKFMAGKINPPVMPQVAREMQRVMKQPKSGSDELAKVIEVDPVISLRLISVANSPVYRGVTQIRNVKNAIPRLGLKETLNVVIAIANKSLYETDKVLYKILMDKMWGHSLAAAYGSKLIAQNLRLEDPENFFLMGLTHDIGKVLLLKAFTGISKQKMLNMNAIQANIQEAHISLGSLLVKRWGFDDKFMDVITRHEDSEFNEDASQEVLVVHLANMLTRRLGFSLFDDDVDFAELQSAQLLKITPETIENIGEELNQILQDVAHLF
jgi:HD-GYP domain-containing protein (c-di-GMP phosphodiesterase class II)